MAKKQTKPKEENLPVLREADLSSSSLAQFANYDLAQFKGVKLDIADNNEVFKNDILIPKIWLVQNMSKVREEKKAEEGQFIDSQTLELLADEGEVLNFVVLKTFKRWHTFELKKEKNKVKKEFVSSEIMTVQNINLPYEETKDGKDLVRRQVISAYVLVQKDVEKGINRPYIIDFASSSKLGGRSVVSNIKTLNNSGLPSFVAFFRLNSKLTPFEEGSAFVKETQFGGYLPKELMPFLLDCYKGIEIIEDQVVIDDRDIIDTTTTDEVETKVNKKAKKSGANI